MDFDVVGGRICWRRPTASGESSPEPLCNFAARITEYIVHDDGSYEHGELLIEGVHESGQPLGVARVPASRFRAMTWPLEMWGPGIIIAPGPGARERLAVAIQILSQRADGLIRTRRIRQQSGWQEIDGHRLYVSAGHMIGAHQSIPAVDVELPGRLGLLDLPSPPTGAARQAAIRASLAVLDLAPLQVTAPLLAATYQAPLRELFGREVPDLTCWVSGPPVSQKSELAALGQGHYGAAFTRLTLPASFADTPAALERTAHAMKDALCVVDDDHLASGGERHEMARVASRLLRNAGNQTGRQRVDAGLRRPTSFPPRCLPLVTAEHLPDGESSTARVFPVAVSRGQVDLAKLASAQAERDRGTLALAMAGYLQYVARHWEHLAASLPTDFHALRARAASAGSHARGPGQVAHLYLGLATMTAYAVEARAMRAADRATLLDRCWAALVSVDAERVQDALEDSPVARFLAALAEGFDQGTAILESIPSRAIFFPEPEMPTFWGWRMSPYRVVDGRIHVKRYERPAGATHLGWVDGDYGVGTEWIETGWLLLFPDATYRFVSRVERQSDRALPDPRTLWRLLDEAGVIATETEGTSRRRIVNVRMGKMTRRLLKLRASAVERGQAALTEALAQGGAS